MAKTKRAGFLTKLVVLILLIYLSTALLDMKGRIAHIQAEKESLTQQVAWQTQRNTELADAVQHSDDPAHINDVAREKLGLVEPGEKVFIFTN